MFVALVSYLNALRYTLRTTLYLGARPPLDL